MEITDVKIVFINVVRFYSCSVCKAFKILAKTVFKINFLKNIKFYDGFK